jgi:hypothetical protein
LVQGDCKMMVVLSECHLVRMQHCTCRLGMRRHTKTPAQLSLLILLNVFNWACKFYCVQKGYWLQGAKWVRESQKRVEWKVTGKME